MTLTNSTTLGQSGLESTCKWRPTLHSLKFLGLEPQYLMMKFSDIAKTLLFGGVGGGGIIQRTYSELSWRGSKQNFLTKEKVFDVSKN